MIFIGFWLDFGFDFGLILAWIWVGFGLDLGWIWLDFAIIYEDFALIWILLLSTRILL